MQDANDKDETKDWCKCPNCYGSYGRGNSGWHHYGHRFFFLRWFLGLIILAMAFSIGVKIGEFKGEFEGAYGDGYLMRHSPWMMRGDGDSYRYMMLPNPTTPPSPQK